MKTAFFIELRSHEKFTPDEYTEESGKLANVLQGIFGDKEKLALLTKAAALSSCHSEVEISHDPQCGLVAKCVVDIDAPSRVSLDKAKLTALFKAATGFQSMKVEKRAVEMTEEPA